MGAFQANPEYPGGARGNGNTLTGRKSSGQPEERNNHKLADPAKSLLPFPAVTVQEAKAS